MANGNKKTCKHLSVKLVEPCATKNGEVTAYSAYCVDCGAEGFQIAGKGFTKHEAPGDPTR